MTERDIPTQEESNKFMASVPELISQGSNGQLFPENSKIVRIGAKDLLLSVSVGEDKIITNRYKLVGETFVEYGGTVDSGAIKDGIVQIPLTGDHFLPLEE